MKPAANNRVQPRGVAGGGGRRGELGDRSFGRWTREEHEGFLLGLRVHGREWKKVAQTIKTRTPAQIRSHAQKYFAKSTTVRGAGASDASQASVQRMVRDSFRALAEKKLELTNARRDQGDDDHDAHRFHLERAAETEPGAVASPPRWPLAWDSLSASELVALSVMCGPQVGASSEEQAQKGGTREHDAEESQRANGESTAVNDQKRLKLASEEKLEWEA